MELRLTEEELMLGIEGALPNPSPTSPRANIPPTQSAPSLFSDPSTLGFPPMLAMEMAMKTGTPEEIFSGYGFDYEDMVRLSTDVSFLNAVKTAQ